MPTPSLLPLGFLLLSGGFLLLLGFLHQPWGIALAVWRWWQCLLPCDPTELLRGYSPGLGWDWGWS